MGLFNKLFKINCEGLIEAYLQTYKKIKNKPQFQIAAELFEEELKLPTEFYFVNTTIKQRQYKQHQLEAVLEIFMLNVKHYVEKPKSLNETQLLIALLIAAHFVETGFDMNPNFEAIAKQYIDRYFDKSELSNKMDIQELSDIFWRETLAFGAGQSAATIYMTEYMTDVFPMA